MCPESLKTHHAVPLFHFAGIRLFRQAFPISVHDLHRRQRRPAAPGLCFRAGLRSVRGGFNCHPVRLSFSRLSLSLPPFLVQSTSSKKPWTQMRESLRISASAQRQCSRSPCPDLKILSVTGIPAPDPFDQTEGYIGDLLVTHFQLKVIGHPTENMDFCHTTPFCRKGNTYI